MLTDRHYAWLAVGFLALAVYGSLVPFRYRPMPLGEAVDQFRAVCSAPVRMESRSDWTANILLFIPLSYLCMAAMSVDQARIVGVLAALLVIPCCALLSTAIEFTQLFFPPRVSSVNDIAAESIGGFLGSVLWLVWGQRVTNSSRRLWNGFGNHGLAARLLPGYLVFLVLIHLMPFDLTISPVEIYHKYHEGRIQLVPFAAQQADSYRVIGKGLLNLGYFFPVGLLLAGLPNPVWQQQRSWLRVLGLGLGLSGLVEILQLFVYSRFCDATDVITGSGAVLAGWSACLVFRRVEGPPVRAGEENSQDDCFRFWRSPKRIGLFFGWLCLLVFLNWQPFDFMAPPGMVARRLQKMSFLPFADYYKGDYLNSFDQIGDKTLLFLPVGALLASVGHRAARDFAGLRVTLTAFILATGLEAGQLFLPTRYPSVTDVLIETFGAWVGFALASRIWANLQANPPALSTWGTSGPASEAFAERHAWLRSSP